MTRCSVGFSVTAVGVVVDEATRGDYTDFMRWLQTPGKTGGARRARANPTSGRLNRETGKVAPDDRAFDPATFAHSRIVLHKFYEFLTVDYSTLRALVANLCGLYWLAVESWKEQLRWRPRPLHRRLAP